MHIIYIYIHACTYIYIYNIYIYYVFIYKHISKYNFLGFSSFETCVYMYLLLSKNSFKQIFLRNLFLA